MIDVVIEDLHTSDTWSVVTDWRNTMLEQLELEWYPTRTDLTWTGAFVCGAIVAAAGVARLDDCLVVHDVYRAWTRTGNLGMLALLRWHEERAERAKTPLLFLMPELHRAHPMARHLARWGYRPNTVMYLKEPVCRPPS